MTEITTTDDKKFHVGNMMIAFRNVGVLIQVYTLWLVLELKVRAEGLSSLLQVKYILAAIAVIVWVYVFFKWVRPREMASNSGANAYMLKQLANQKQIISMLEGIREDKQPWQTELVRPTALVQEGSNDSH